MTRESWGHGAGWLTAAGRGPGGHDPGQDGSDELWAMLSYLGAIFGWLLAPLAIYLAKRNESQYVRCHAAQALNLVITASLFGVSCVIVGGLLALDTLAAALIIMSPVACALWLAMLVYLLQGAAAASRGEFYEIPSWLCVPVIR